MFDDLRRTLHQHASLSRKVFGKKECLHPEAPHKCSGQIVRAHTVQKSGALSLIADGGHVLTLDLDPETEDGKLVKAKKEGIRQASTFSGYCQSHDNQMFAPIEDHPLELTRRHAFLLAYRAISRERFGKLRMAELIPKSVDAGTISGEDGQLMQFGTALADQDAHIFNEMKDAYMKGNLSRTKFYSVEFDAVPDIMCSSSTNVIFDFEGNIIQNMYKDPARERPFDIISLSTLPRDEGRGVAIFAWYGKSTVNEKFIKSLHKLPKRDIPNILVRFLFYNFENIFWSPAWWKKLPEAAQNNLLSLAEHRNFHPEPFYDLRPDGHRYVNWKAVGKRKNNLGLRG